MRSHSPESHSLGDQRHVRSGRKRVPRLIRSAGLASVHRRRSVRTTRRGPTWSGFLYLAVVVDAGAGAWWTGMGTHLRTELVSGARHRAR